MGKLRRALDSKKATENVEEKAEAASAANERAKRAAADLANGA